MRAEGYAWLAAGILILAGLITVAVGLSTPVGFGWFAYQPLADATFMPGGNGVVVSRTTVVGSVVFVAGLVGLAFLAGVRMGRRTPEG